MADRTFILTLMFDEETFARLDELRRRHFPPHLNLIPAHLTLFHKLDGDLSVALREAARVAPFALSFPGLRKLGRGVALNVECPPLLELRGKLATRLAEQLTSQDQQGFRPHVTIQNKVAPEAALALYDALAATFQPFEGQAIGLLMWRYLGGPWRLEAEHPFEC